MAGISLCFILVYSFALLVYARTPFIMENKRKNVFFVFVNKPQNVIIFSHTKM